MRIVLATGLYPPAIGGTATYAEGLANELSKRGHEVWVVTYGVESGKWKVPARMRSDGESGKWEVIGVSKVGSVFSRWMRYAKALRASASDADVVIALSSVSVGIPLILARLRRPKKILRLGGDFFWERATDAGCRKSLRAWYGSTFGIWRIINTALMEGIFSCFDCLVYSTEFQKKIHEEHYRMLPKRVVIENAGPLTALIPACPAGRPRPLPPKGEGESRKQHVPLRLLFMGRFVGFKNLSALIAAMRWLPEAVLTMVGEGPLEKQLRREAELAGLQDHILFHPPVHGKEKSCFFADHDLLLLPSVTEISPNVALEALSEGLPVLLTEETGYRKSLSPLLVLRPLRTQVEIVAAVHETMRHLPKGRAGMTRGWETVAQEWITLLSSL